MDITKLLTRYDTTSLVSQSKNFHIELTDRQIAQYLTYYELLVEKNKVMNLTAITDFNEVVERHFIDSLAIRLYEDFADVQSVIDIGTGAGFPGIPLAIAFPDISFTLLDSLAKRTNFLNEVCDALSLTNVNILTGRAEDFGSDADYRETFDLAVSRAVSSLSPLCEYCLPFVRTGGHFTAYKSVKVEEELGTAENAISILGGKLHSVQHYNIGDIDRDCAFIRIDKITETPTKYPRRAGKPTKKPL